jgi:phage terminase small subunit
MLTPKQQRFVDEYLIDLNATQAAIRAGYEASNADVTGPRMLGNVGIAGAIAERQQERSEKTQIDAAWMLLRLADEATADLADLYGEDGQLLPIKQWPLIWRQGLVAGIEAEELTVEGVTMGIVRKVKLSDRVKRLELIGRHVNVQAFKENVEVTVTDRAAQLQRARQRKAADAGPDQA